VASGAGGGRGGRRRRGARRTGRLLRRHGTLARAAVARPAERDGVPDVADAGGDQHHQVAAPQHARLRRELEREHLIDLAQVAVVGQVDRARLVDAERAQQVPVGARLHVQHRQVGDLVHRRAGLAHGLAHDGDEVAERQLLEPRLHAGRVGHVQAVVAGVVGGDRRHRAADGHQHVEREAAVGQDVRRADRVAAAALDDHRAAAGAEVEHEAHVRVVQVDQVAVAVAAGDQHHVDVGIGGELVARQLEGQHRGAALLPDVEGVGAMRAEVVRQLDAGGPDRVLLVLLGDADHHVDVGGRASGALEGGARGLHGHRGRLVVVGGQHAAAQAELVAHHPGGDAGDLGELLRAHAPLGDVRADAGDARGAMRGHGIRGCGRVADARPDVAAAAHEGTSRPWRRRSKTASSASGGGSRSCQMA
jgi:hypothetical protein